MRDATSDQDDGGEHGEPPRHLLQHGLQPGPADRGDQRVRAVDRGHAERRRGRGGEPLPRREADAGSCRWRRSASPRPARPAPRPADRRSPRSARSAPADRSRPGAAERFDSRLKPQYTRPLGGESPGFSCALVRRGSAGSSRRRRAIAQLAEHRSPKPKVGGSSPSCPAPHVLELTRRERPSWQTRTRWSRPSRRSAARPGRRAATTSADAEPGRGRTIARAGRRGRRRRPRTSPTTDERRGRRRRRDGDSDDPTVLEPARRRCRPRPAPRRPTSGPATGRRRSRHRKGTPTAKRDQPAKREPDHAGQVRPAVRRRAAQGRLSDRRAADQLLRRGPGLRAVHHRVREPARPRLRRRDLQDLQPDDHRPTQVTEISTCPIPFQPTTPQPARRSRWKAPSRVRTPAARTDADFDIDLGSYTARPRTRSTSTSTSAGDAEAERPTSDDLDLDFGDPERRAEEPEDESRGPDDDEADAGQRGAGGVPDRAARASPATGTWCTPTPGWRTGCCRTWRTGCPRSTWRTTSTRSSCRPRRSPRSATASASRSGGPCSRATCWSGWTSPTSPGRPSGTRRR